MFAKRSALLLVILFHRSIGVMSHHTLYTAFPPLTIRTDWRSSRSQYYHETMIVININYRNHERTVKESKPDRSTYCATDEHPFINVGGFLVDENTVDGRRWMCMCRSLPSDAVILSPFHFRLSPS